MGSSGSIGVGRKLRVLRDGAPEWGAREGEEVVLDSGDRIPEAGAHYLAPVEPTKIMAVHLTYLSRVEEYAASIPPQPSYFLKPPTTLNGHRGTVRRPRGTRFLNYEGELAAVVGHRMKGVPMEEVLSYIAGYTGANDVGLHDFRHADRGSMLRVKGQDGFLPLEPGDVILTGTPANSRPMESGDVVEVEIEGIGRLSNTVEEWDVDLTGPGVQPETSANTLHVALAVPEDEAERMVAEESR